MSEQVATPSPMVFETPEPVRLRLRVPAGRIEIRAEAVDRTTIRVAPMDEHREIDQKAAAQTSVFHNGNDIHVELPDRARSFLRNGAIRVTAAVPAGSMLHGEIAAADLDTSGVLGDGSLKVASGDVRMDTLGTLVLETASGDVTVGAVTGDLEVKSASGEVRVGQVDAAVRVKTASGDVVLGDVLGEVRTGTASGDITVRRLQASASCSTMSGDLEIERVGTGTVQTKTVSGDISIGVPAGTAAWLQVKSASGDVNSRLEATDGPAEDDATVQVLANSVSGDVTVRRAEP